MVSNCWSAVLLTLAGALAFGVCGCGDGDAVAAPPDVSGVEVDLRVRRFDQDLRRAALDSLPDGGARVNGAQVLAKAYPIFFDSVFVRLMGLPEGVAGYDSALVTAFRTEPSLRGVLDSVTAVFPEGQQGQAAATWQRDLEQAFRYARHYFPDEPTPEVVTYVSEFSLGNLTYGRELLGVGLDFYLGADFPGYSREVFPAYVQRSMNAEHLAARAIETWLTNLLGPAPGERMIDRMVHNGKLLYLKSELLPHVADTAVLNFSAPQLQWLRDNEAPMWTHYLDEDLLYETSAKRIGKHVGVAPGAPGMPKEAPGGGANWVGMRMVESYMRRHPDVTAAGVGGAQGRAGADDGGAVSAGVVEGCSMCTVHRSLDIST